MFESFYESYLKNLQLKYPSAIDSLNSDGLRQLVSPFEVKISPEQSQLISNTVSRFYSLSRTKEYQEKINSEHPDFLELDLDQGSVLMAYDFHINNSELKLIEVNTNAAGFLFSELLYETKGIPNNYSELLKDSFLEDFKTSKKVAIIDENVTEQNMYLEFLMYKDLFNSWGLEASVLNYDDPNFDNGFDAVYNRYCDFYFENESSQNLKKLYLDKKIIFSPHPKEYLLLADKERLIELSSHSNDYPALAPVLLETKDIKSIDPDELWKTRKKYFFKPKSSFGSKSTYRGKSLTRKNFERMINENALIQEICPPQQAIFNDEQWKIDLRAYAYKGQVQMLIARVYQGQLTNFRTEYGGFATIKIDLA